MNAMKKFDLLALAALTGVSLCAEPTISDVTITPVEPIGFKIEYSVSGATVVDLKRPLEVSLLAKTIDGDTTCTNSDCGTKKTLYWNAAADGISINEATVSVQLRYKEAPVPNDDALYCVIDLSGGSSATSYPVTYLYDAPDGGFNKDEYKTTKLVLKRIDAGSFIMDSRWYNESCRVTLTKAFYMGIFQVTQKQYQLVVGANPSSFRGDAESSTYDPTDDEKKPVEQVSYNMIRGYSKGSQWPSSNAVDSWSFLGKLRARTGVDFDLPTDAQWEYACRAGTTTEWNFGDTEANFGDYMWGERNSDGTTHNVGEKKPNDWGLYDMHGNVSEWCLDWYGALTYGSDPTGAATGDGRVIRGGGWNWGTFDSAAYCRGFVHPATAYNSSGFRLARTLP